MDILLSIKKKIFFWLQRSELSANYQLHSKPDESSNQNIIEIDFPACIESEFQEDFAAAWASVEEILESVQGADFSPLEGHSPALKGFNWENYLRVSVIRMLHTTSLLTQHGVLTGQVLDYGSYFGNFSLFFSKKGYKVDAADSHLRYRSALGKAAQLLASTGVRLLDLEDIGYDLHEIAPHTYDIVLCMGVIEHIPHTPRMLLESINRVLKPGGYLVLDSPNLAYIYNRQKLSRGETIFCPITLQYYTEAPFEGHHREYTISEVRWMLEQINHKIITLKTFNYSIFGLKSLQGTDLENFNAMLNDPECREVIIALSRKTP